VQLQRILTLLFVAMSCPPCEQKANAMCDHGNLKKLDFYRGWVHSRFCDQCSRRISRSENRFECQTCEATVCTECIQACAAEKRDSLKQEQIDEARQIAQDDMVRRNSLPSQPIWYAQFVVNPMTQFQTYGYQPGVVQIVPMSVNACHGAVL